MGIQNIECLETSKCSSSATQNADRKKEYEKERRATRRRFILMLPLPILLMESSVQQFLPVLAKVSRRETR